MKHNSPKNQDMATLEDAAEQGQYETFAPSSQRRLLQPSAEPSRWYPVWRGVIPAMIFAVITATIPVSLDDDAMDYWINYALIMFAYVAAMLGVDYANQRLYSEQLNETYGILQTRYPWGLYITSDLLTAFLSSVVGFMMKFDTDSNGLAIVSETLMAGLTMAGTRTGLHRFWERRDRQQEEPVTFGEKVGRGFRRCLGVD